ncbi:MAG: hypothetical protein LUG98_02420 [Tannerellaceae bacterium]|nr:hypothetical protein [Tannerellaceae bacterium]
MKYNLVILFLSMSIPLFPQTTIVEKQVREAVERQLETYPASTLRDLYKNFFQDRYGPGHLINDTTAAGNYLRRELSTMQESSGELIEPTGREGNFYRVNLSLVKEEVIPYDIFFDAFVRSVNAIQAPPVEVWTKEWEQIEQIIRNMELNLPDYESDRKAIAGNLKQGEYVGHHSKAFEEAYSPHYRIVSKPVFETELLPLLQTFLTNPPE